MLFSKVILYSLHPFSAAVFTRSLLSAPQDISAPPPSSQTTLERFLFAPSSFANERSFSRSPWRCRFHPNRVSVTSAGRSSSLSQSCTPITHFSSPSYRSPTLPSAANHEHAAQLKKSLVSFPAVISLSPRLCKRVSSFFFFAASTSWWQAISSQTLQSWVYFPRNNQAPVSRRVWARSPF